MSQVIFLRAVNVGGRKLRPKLLADELGWVNVGAAGTFVALKATTPRAVELAIRRKLPFETTIMVCPGEEILRMVKRWPIDTPEPKGDVRRLVTILEDAPVMTPKLPIEKPEGTKWQVKVAARIDRYMFSLWRPQKPKLIYPNEVVERNLKMVATTRGWDTMLTIGKILQH